MISAFSLGADPEIVVRKYTTSGPTIPIKRRGTSSTSTINLGKEFPTSTPFPACGMFGGEKGKPIERAPFGGWLEDGVMLELNPAPASDAYQLNYNVQNLIGLAREFVSTKNTAEVMFDLGYPSRATYYSSEDLAKDPRATAFGCAPDLCAYSPDEPRMGVMDAAMKEFGESVRFAGGHVHLGLDPWPEELPKFIVARFLDLLLGIPSSRKWGEETQEREIYYGVPGLYRETSYGIEYRTPTNRWLTEATQPWFLIRLMRIGQLFASYEANKSSLIDLYNSVNWNLLNNAYQDRDYPGVYEALSSVNIIKFDRQDYLSFGSTSFCISSHTIDVQNTENISEKKTFAVPGNRLLELGRLQLADEHIDEEEVEAIEREFDEEEDLPQIVFEEPEPPPLHLEEIPLMDIAARERALMDVWGLVPPVANVNPRDFWEVGPGAVVHPNEYLPAEHLIRRR